MAHFHQNDIMSLTGDKPRFDLAESYGPDLIIEDLLDASSKRQLQALKISYGTAAGDQKLRQMIAERHLVEADDVVVTVGGMHGLFLLALILCGKGDDVVLTSPLFPPARDILETLDARILVLSLCFEKGYQIDDQALRAALSPSTRLVSLASPQNPSGVAFSKDTVSDILSAMEAVCPQAHLLLDASYREASYGDDPIASSYVELSPKVISCGSLSKCHGAPGLRLGWVVTRDKALRQQMVLGKFGTVLSASAVDEFLALKVLEKSDELLSERCQLLANGLSIVTDWMRGNEIHVEWIRPDAGALCCVRLRPEVFDDATVGRFYEELEKRETRVARGSWFGDEERVFRVGFGAIPMPDLKQGLSCITDALNAALK